MNMMVRSKTYRLVNTKYLHLMTKQNVIRTCLLPETEIALCNKHVSFFGYINSKDFFCFGSIIITQSQIKLEEPAFMVVSSMIYSLIFLILGYFQGLYF